MGIEEKNHILCTRVGMMGFGYNRVWVRVLITSGVKKVEVDRDDVEGIQVLYGTNPDNNGTTGPSLVRER
ncbi:hypothetical protein HanIR_Chr17g0901721 [Helianthus annuus]|nr:hypothetical protein HanIR_Chr17g0901721 [Helianthus annuus]